MHFKNTILGLFAAAASLWGGAFPCRADEEGDPALTFRGFSGIGLLFPEAVAVQGSFAYVADRWSERLHIFDISNPDMPIPRGTIASGGGAAKSVAVQGDFAYVVVDILAIDPEDNIFQPARLQIFDVSDPDNIVARDFEESGIVGSDPKSWLPFLVEMPIVVEGDHAYVATIGADRLQIYDISDPDNIVLRDHESIGFSSKAGLLSLAVRDGFAYVLGGTFPRRLHILDVSDPTDIVRRGSTGHSFVHPSGIAVQGSFAYTIDNGQGSLQIFDISDPDNPVPRDFDKTGLDAPESIAVHGAIAYVGDQNTRRLQLFDISDPDAIVPLCSSAERINIPYSIAVAGDFIYVVDWGGNDELLVFEFPERPLPPASDAEFRVLSVDFERPASATVHWRSRPGGFYQIDRSPDLSMWTPLVSEYPPGGAISKSSSYTDTSELGGGAYYRVRELETTLSEIELVPADFDATGLGKPIDLALQGDFAYVVDQETGLLRIFDVSDPANIVPRDSDQTNLQHPRSIAVQGDFAYVVDSSLAGLLQIFDISNPDAIVPRGSDGTRLANPDSIAVSGDFAYVLDIDSDLLQIFDVSDRDAIVARGWVGFGMPLGNSQIVVDGSVAYVADQRLGLHAFDVSDPDNITSLDNVDTVAPYDLFAANGFVYTVDSEAARLQVYDVSDPENITPRGFSETGLSEPVRVTVQGDLAFVGDLESESISVFDVSDPDQIFRRGVFHDPEVIKLPASMAVRGDLLYANAFFNGRFQIFRIQER